MFPVIHQCASNFGPPPREFSLLDRLTYFRVPRPLFLWLNPSDDLMILLRYADILFRDGVVVWGYLIQANQLMFESGIMNCPGEVVYSLEDAGRAEPEYLQQVAHTLFSLKGTYPADPQLAPIASYLTNEMIRVFGLPVPFAISPNLRCRISTTLFVRKHLPQRRLCSPLLPLIVNPRAPHVALPLPARYWPPPFADWWAR